ncbi:hypothetical protein U8C32_12690 [Sinorhizobium medicae]|uniref:hypothetical protein n=1 Tax=Sinorhizobium medicae TaxID=110321 RepID=UPI002AF6A998|nr:hypothetical protein [Sinorhizobium medicae]WQO44130.1 hypothetical protein U8C42_12840 [Sinorhizobium medicae]WQO66892.1 hypothetical protein U8C40_07050 [Sinorhizobium medicae]WQO71281.1 hypothetical protein U8C31_13325 [Sinorhizobium medicae]WQO90700.1 hypothetical protein U8C32_12690 [Sinorhizobium medicae]
MLNLKFGQLIRVSQWIDARAAAPLECEDGRDDQYRAGGRHLRIAKYMMGLLFIASLLVAFMLSNLLSRKVIVHVENRSSNVIAVEVVLWEPNIRDYGDEPVSHLLRFNLEPGEALQRLLLPAYGGGNIGTAVRDGPNEYWDYGQYLLGMGSFFYLEKYTVVYSGSGVIKTLRPSLY